jgi:Tn3 transposase DDE domain
MLALHLLQAALVHVNTALLQIILAEPHWRDRMTDADRRALTPLFWTHVNLYGKFDLDMSTRLDLAALTPIAADGLMTPVTELRVAVPAASSEVARAPAQDLLP